MRRLPRLARQLDLSLVETFSYVPAETGEAASWVSAIESLRKLAPASVVMGKAEATAWADGQLRASRDGVFFGAGNYYGYVLRRS